MQIRFKLITTVTILVGCNSGIIEVRDATDIIPLTSNIARPTTIMCGDVTEGSKVRMLACPALDQIVEYDYRDEPSVTLNDYALFEINGSMLSSSTHVDSKARFLNERVSFGGWTMRPLQSVDEGQVLGTLRDVCATDRDAFDVVVTRVEEGCSLTDARTDAGAGTWIGSLKALALGGKQLGKGTFRAEHINDAKFEPDCQSKVPVAVHVISRLQFCSTYVTPIWSRVLHGLQSRFLTLGKDAESSRIELRKAREQVDAAEGHIASLQIAIRDLNEAVKQARADLQKSKNQLNKKAISETQLEVMVRNADEQLEGLKKTNTEQAEQIKSAEQRLKEREVELARATRELEKVLPPPGATPPPMGPAKPPVSVSQPSGENQSPITVTDGLPPNAK
jgi:hypothetical protein